MDLPPLLEQLDLVRKVLLHLPPDQPACFVRASLVCRDWLSILSDPAFIRDYRVFHRKPPLIGFFQNLRFYDLGDDVPRFVPNAVPSPLAETDLHFLVTDTVIDCRHGLVLFRREDDDFVVWDPATRLQYLLPRLPEGPYRQDYFTAAVMCAAPGCDHLYCRRSAFRVILAGTESNQEDSVTYISIYSSENMAWSAPTTDHVGPRLTVASHVMGPSLLTGGMLYFFQDYGSRIVSYTLDSDVLSVIDPPPYAHDMFLMTMEDGGLRAAGVVNYSLQIWSWQPAASGFHIWVQDHIISMETLITLRLNNPETIINVIGFAEMAGYLFISTHDEVYSFDLKLGWLKKICDNGTYLDVFPYECFYTLGPHL